MLFDISASRIKYDSTAMHVEPTPTSPSKSRVIFGTGLGRQGFAQEETGSTVLLTKTFHFSVPLKPKANRGFSFRK